MADSSTGEKALILKPAPQQERRIGMGIASTTSDFRLM
jgi:hypothetical protein